jgi:hypothetical protein
LSELDKTVNQLIKVIDQSHTSALAATFSFLGLFLTGHQLLAKISALLQ